MAAHIIWFLIVGLVSGRLAGVLIEGGGHGLVGDLVVGVLGAMIGESLFHSGGRGLIVSVAVATVGAVLLLVIVRILERA